MQAPPAMNAPVTPIASAQRAHSQPSISCVVPCFNEAQNLSQLLPELKATLSQLTPNWEILLVDDGSRDDTHEVVHPHLASPGVRLLVLSRNFGKEAALSAGLDHAAGQLVVLMDADGQHPLSLLPAMLAGWREGADTVCAVRDGRSDESLTKRIGTHLFYGIVNAGSPVRIPRDAGDFRLMDRCVVNALLALPERNRFLKGLYAWVGFRTQFLLYEPAERRHGVTRFSFTRLMRLALTGLTAFSSLPLRMWGGLGAIVAVAALVYGLYVVVDYLYNHNPVPGWPTVVVSLMFFSGVQLLSIGILGEYIGRIFTEVKRRPVYLLREASGQGLPKECP